MKGRPVWRRPRVLSQLATIDLETDPFKAGRIPKPFVAGYFHPKDGFHHFWGADCVAQLVAFLATISEPRLIYAHNGGHYDYHWFEPWVRTSAREPFFIKTRLVAWSHGIHELRDSFPILPAALGKMEGSKKERIAIEEKFEAGEREKHHLEITRYLKADCTELHRYVTGFVSEFGPKYTASSAALKALKGFQPYRRLSASSDEYLRKWFHGGRVECLLGRGIFPGPWNVYDVNSMYPHAMAEYRHPLGNRFTVGRRVTEETFFLTLECASGGAFAAIDDEGELRFPDDGEIRVFDTTIHEYRAARALGVLKRHKIVETVDFNLSGDFLGFVEHFYERKREAQATKDAVAYQVFKIILNGAFGKTGIDPRAFRHTVITAGHHRPRPIRDDWSLIEENQHSGTRIWQRPLDHEADQLWRKYEHVGIAASITGAARAVLMRAIARCRAAGFEPAYCDTDSLICKGLPLDMLDNERLGAWKLELEGGRKLAIAGKKTYALKDSRGKLAKFGCKGVAPADPWEVILRAAEGRKTVVFRDAPTFTMAGNVQWQARTVRATVPVHQRAGLPLTAELVGDDGDDEDIS